VLAPGDHYNAIGGSYFGSDSYYNFDGNRSPLQQGGLHEERALFSYNEWGWTKGRTFILGFPYKGVTRREGAPSAEERSETGFGDLLVGVRFKLKDGPRALSLEGDWNPPMGYNRNLSPSIGVGASSLIGKLQFGAEMGSRSFVELEGGYRYYIDKVSPTDQMVAGATVGFWLGQSILIAGRYVGHFGKSSQDTTYQALVNTSPQGDTWSTSDAVPGTTNDAVSTQLAGPMLVYRIDDRFDVIAGSLHTASAKNALHVDQFYVAVAVKQTHLNRLRGLLGNTRNP